MLKKVMLGIMLGMCFMFTGCKYSEGERSGELIKFSEKGLIINSNEGILQTGQTAVGQWQFSVKDSNKEAIAILRNSVGREVTVHYEVRKAEFGNIGYDTNRFITSVDLK
jgi:hypothetical protein